MQGETEKQWDMPAVLVCMTYPTLLAWLNFVVLPGSDGSNRMLQIVFGVGKALQFVLPVGYALVLHRELLRRGRISSAGLGTGFVFGVAVALAMFALYFWGLKGTGLLAQTPAKIYDWLTEFGLASTSGYIVLALFIAVLHSALEEYYWRWFVFGRLRARLSFAAAALISALAFMAHHVVVLYFYLPGYFWQAAAPLSLCIAVGGFVWAWLYARTRSLAAVWLSHCLVDLAIMAVGYDLVASRLAL